MNVITRKRNIKDHKARWLTTSIAGIYFIWLKIKGWGIPQKVEAKEVKKKGRKVDEGCCNTIF